MKEQLSALMKQWLYAGIMTAPAWMRQLPGAACHAEIPAKISG